MFTLMATAILNKYSESDNTMNLDKPKENRQFC